MFLALAMVGDEGFEFVVESFLVVEVVEVDTYREYLRIHNKIWLDFKKTSFKRDYSSNVSAI